MPAAKGSARTPLGPKKKIDIGSSPHVLIADDDNAGGEVTKHSNNREDAVDDAQGEKGWPVYMGVTKCILYVGCYVFMSRDW